MRAQPPMPRQVSRQTCLALPTRPVHWVCVQAAVSRRQVFVQRGVASASGAARAVTQAQASSAARRLAIIVLSSWQLDCRHEAYLNGAANVNVYQQGPAG